MYEGQYEGGKQHRQGIMKYSNGGIYEGGWKDNKQHGRGIFKWISGSVYEGQYEGGRQHGQGVFKYSNGGRCHMSYVIFITIIDTIIPTNYTDDA
jgi:hypothetical protein